MAAVKSDYDIISWSFPGDICIYPISDVHYGALNHDRKAWANFCRKIEAEENSFVVCNGDMINNNTRSAVGSPFDDFCRPREQKEKMVEYLSPIKDKLLCVVSGNHEKRSLKDCDDDPLYDICCKLNIEDIYRPNAAFLAIGLGVHPNGARKASPLTTHYIAVTHGSGGGIYTGATVNRNERWGNLIEGANCVIVGHTHKGTVTRPSRLRFDSRSKRVLVSDYLVVSSVAWQNYGDYALQKMLLPSASSKPQKLILYKDNKNIEVRW